MNEIKKWLAGDRNWYNGVDLYQRYGNNPHLKRQFEKLGESTQRREKLEYELQKLARQPMAAPRPQKQQKRAKTAPKATKEVVQVVQLPDLTPQEVLAYSNPKVQAINFDSLPDALKTAYLELIEHEKKARIIHHTLKTVDPETEAERRGKMAHDIVFAKDRAAEIYERIDHWVSTGEVLSTEKPSINVKTMTDMELLQKEKNLKSSVSRLGNSRLSEIMAKIGRLMNPRKKQIEEGKLSQTQELLNQHRADLKAVRDEIELRNGQGNNQS